MPTLHKSITAERIMDRCIARDTTLDNPGICISCGADADGCEPDARNYECESCGQKQVFGAEEILLMIM